MLKHLAKPHGIVALVLVAFAAAWAFWTFVWLPRADVQQLAPPPPSPATTPP